MPSPTSFLLNCSGWGRCPGMWIFNVSQQILGTAAQGTLMYLERCYTAAREDFWVLTFPSLWSYITEKRLTPPFLLHYSRTQRGSWDPKRCIYVATLISPQITSAGEKLQSKSTPQMGHVSGWSRLTPCCVLVCLDSSRFQPLLIVAVKVLIFLWGMSFISTLDPLVVKGNCQTNWSFTYF